MVSGDYFPVTAGLQVFHSLNITSPRISSGFMAPFFLSGSNYVATLTVGGAGAHASYYHKANDQVAFWFYISFIYTKFSF